MDELTFRAKDRHRRSWLHLAQVGALLALAGTRIAIDLGIQVLLWTTGGLAALIGLHHLAASEPWSTVGPAGVTIRGTYRRRARAHPWRDIRWIDVYEAKSPFGTYRAPRIHLADGRRQVLAGLSQDPTHPSPDFDEQVRRVRGLWELNTDPAARVRPAERRRDRLTPGRVGFLTAVPVLIVAFLLWR
ncbi:hypothetical protein ABT093_04570 [Kitasatospora sp. NPDC002551]|uniref:hypothetical protein n=1 Tax=unclassified Kitasatospora TaxID=2633591 RepID=UPI0033176C01